MQLDISNIKRILGLASQGVEPYFISERLGVSPGHVWRVFRAHGIPLPRTARNTSRSHALRDEYERALRKEQQRHSAITTVLSGGRAILHGDQIKLASGRYDRA